MSKLTIVEILLFVFFIYAFIQANYYYPLGQQELKDNPPGKLKFNSETGIVYYPTQDDYKYVIEENNWASLTILTLILIMSMAVYEIIIKIKAKGENNAERGSNTEIPEKT